MDDPETAIARLNGGRRANEETWRGNESITVVRISGRVVAVQARQFFECEQLREIHVSPSSRLETIGPYAFSYCHTLVENPLFGLPSLRSIGKCAFLNCRALVHIQFGDNLTTLGVSSFACCFALKTVRFGTGVHVVPVAAFRRCESLEQVELPPQATHLRGRVFSGAIELRSIDIPLTVQEIGRFCFASTSLRTLDLSQHTQLAVLGAKCFQCCDEMTTLTLPPNLTEIPQHLCQDNENLVEVKIPPSVTSIGENAFEGCEKLPSISLPPRLTSIERRTFYFCESLLSIEFPDSVSTIGESACEHCESLRQVQFGSTSLVQVGRHSFFGCKRLTSIHFPCSPSNVEQGALDARYLKTVRFGEIEVEVVQKRSLRITNTGVQPALLPRFIASLDRLTGAFDLGTLGRQETMMQFSADHLGRTHNDTAAEETPTSIMQ